jgi:putative transposase
MVTPAAKREAVAHLQAPLDVSERRACRVIAVDRSLIRYQSRRPDDADLRKKLRDLAHQRRRFGYRRLHILLLRDGVIINGRWERARRRLFWPCPTSARASTS